MSLSYEFDHKLAALAPVLDEHAEWFHYVMRRLFYPEIEAAHQTPITDINFRQWIAVAETHEALEKNRLQNIRAIFTEMQELADQLVKKAEPGAKPEVKLFDQLVDRYDDFVQLLRRLERDSVLADSGIDPSTGLRSRKAMEKDLERELERRARLGKPFCLVLVRIDNFASLQTEIDPATAQVILEKVAALLLLCIRSFDDAYRASDGEFIMALKHSDTAGASAAINRLRRMLVEEPIVYDVKGKARTLTMSYCSAEPIPGDVLENLIKHMRADLDRYDEGGNTAVEYLEQSPLQRFLLSTDDMKKA